MTDREIIKALEYCKDCNANLNFEIINHIERKNIELLELAEIVNRQQIEIEDLRRSYILAVEQLYDETEKMR